MKKATDELKVLVKARGSRLMDLPGVGPVVAARTPGRRRRHRQVRRPQPVRLLDRHRTPRCLLRRTGPAPALPGREPADEPHDPHRRHQPDPPGHSRPRLLPTQTSRGQEPPRSAEVSQARISDAIYRQLLADAEHAAEDSGRAREGTAGRLKNPARSTCLRTSTLRISHFPDPRTRRYNRPSPPGRPPDRDRLRPPVDNKGEPE